MIKEAIGYGDTIEQAREDAILKLNAKSDDDIQFDVLATPKKKILGLFGGEKAQVKAFIELPDNEKPHRKNDKKEKQKPQKEAQAPKKAAKKETSAPKKQTEEAAANFVNEEDLKEGSKALNAVRYLKPILEGLGCTNIKVKVSEKDNHALIDLEGDGIGAIIGHRGETLDALQYLAGLAANNCGGYYKVSLNIGDYRQRREKALINLAGRICEQVKTTGKCRTLEPMNPYERRIIHTAVQAYEGITSASFGEGEDRRVVIGPEGAELKPLRQSRHSDNRRGNRHDNRRPRNNRQNNTVTAAPAREPKKDSDIPLYGKIN